jgi:CRP-like cAMP-binding protein
LIPEKVKPIPKPGNKLLAALPKEDYNRLFPCLEEVTLVYGTTIYEPGEKIRDVYFPSSGIVSLLTAVEEGATLEVGIVGKEGFVGLSVFLGVKTSNTQAIVQGQGLAMKMKAADFLREVGKVEALPRLLQRFTHSLLSQVSQSAACYRFHPIEARLARWLLMTADRAESTEFRITQEFLSDMLGVRREAVNKAAVVLQQKGLIKYSRGHLTILDRKQLEKTTCACYGILRDEEKSGRTF